MLYERGKLQGAEEHADASEAHKEKIQRRLMTHVRLGGEVSELITMGGRSNRLGGAWLEHAMTKAVKLSDEVSVLRASVKEAIDQKALIKPYENKLMTLYVVPKTFLTKSKQCQQNILCFSRRNFVERK